MPGDSAGCAIRGRVVVRIEGVGYLAHRLAWKYCYGDWPKGIIDHIDGSALNNAITNLRDATYKVNGQNKKTATRRSKVGLLGVSPQSGGRCGYRARIDGNYIGLFATPEEAHEAYLQAKRKLHEGNTL